jgi:hypothetical protein
MTLPKNIPNRKSQDVVTRFVSNQHGKIGYFIAWLLGVPASLLFLIFLIRG